MARVQITTMRAATNVHFRLIHITRLSQIESADTLLLKETPTNTRARVSTRSNPRPSCRGQKRREIEMPIAGICRWLTRAEVVRRVAEADDEHGDIVGRVVAVRMVEQLLRRLPWIRDPAHELDRCLVLDHVPEL